MLFYYYRFVYFQGNNHYTYTNVLFMETFAANMYEIKTQNK